MLNNILLRKVASYGEEVQEVKNLNVVNFIFGDNGSGKSTIAKLIENSEAPGFENCELQWDAYGGVQTFVYNREFVNQTLRETKVKGIFTFGEKAGIKQDALEEKIDLRSKKIEKYKNLSNALIEKRAEINREDERFKDKCWDIHHKYKDDFEEAFKNLNRKEIFKNKCIENIGKTSKDTLEELKAQSAIFFNEQPDKINPLPEIGLKRLTEIENNPVYQSIIIGKNDTPIAELIQKLGNSDWVRHGMTYLVSDRCPFCQQIIPDNLRESLERYFDETFLLKMSELESAISAYHVEINTALSHFTEILKFENKFISSDELRNNLDKIKLIFEKNKALLEIKKNEPSKSVEIKKLSDQFAKVNALIGAANRNIAGFNLKIDNFSKEKNILINKIWAFIGNESEENYNDHKKILEPITTAIESMQKNLAEFEGKIEELSKSIAVMEKDLTSTAPSKDEINGILKSFGFDNFHIEDAGEGYYRIARADGTFAQETLSEGEKTFITFLYFYQLIKGNTVKDQVSSQKLVVFDDPVSSLDSKILFIVSTLIRSLYCSDTLSDLNILQIIILTHNVYFHKEIAFMNGLKHLTRSPLKKNKFSYWIVRKHNGTSVITAHEKNPIKTNYQLLWNEVLMCKNDPIPHPGICNTLRRILENYFSVLGGYDIASLPNLFEGAEKIVCKSLTSWVQDGSHCVFEGIDIGLGQDLSGQYITIFEKIFEKTGHKEHFDMMLKSCAN